MPHSPSVTLRPFHEADTEFFAGMASDERVTRLIGDGQPWDHGIEIGYWVSPECWGRGIAGAMLDQALLMVPEVYGTAHLSARVNSANAASAKLLTRRGFQLATHRDGLDHYTMAS